MYSKNDYRYYLEHRLAQSDDFLAHYGVKGMKWKNHKLKNLINDYKKKNNVTGSIFDRDMWKKDPNASGQRLGKSNVYVKTGEATIKPTNSEVAKKNVKKQQSIEKSRSSKKKIKKEKGYVGPARQSKRDQTRDQQAKQAAKELAKERSNVTYNSDGTITFKNTKKRKKK